MQSQYKPRSIEAIRYNASLSVTPKDYHSDAMGADRGVLSVPTGNLLAGEGHQFDEPKVIFKLGKKAVFLVQFTACSWDWIETAVLKGEPIIVGDEPYKIDRIEHQLAGTTLKVFGRQAGRTVPY